jgi:alkylation response protein AidB-like acyl-CoA dehydrogenase
MTTIQSRTAGSRLSATDIISAVRALQPEILARGDEIASLRRLPADLVAKLKAAGAFRIAMPKAWGGPEMTPREQCEVYEVLGAADAAVSWCVKIGSDSGFFAAARRRRRSHALSRSRLRHCRPGTAEWIRRACRWRLSPVRALDVR